MLARRVSGPGGGWPKARMKARRIRSGSRKPAGAPTRSIGSGPASIRSRAISTRNRSTALAGVVPVSAVKARVKLRGLMADWAASRSTFNGSCNRSRAQAIKAPKRPPGRSISSSAENCDWPPGRR